MAEIAFETGLTSNEPVSPEDDNKPTNEPTTHLGDDNPNPADLNNPPDDDKDKNKQPDTPDDKNKQPDDNNEENDLLKQAVPGAEFEIDNTKYIVDNEGNLVDEQGNIFKKKDELKDYFDGLNQSDEDDKSQMSLANVIEAVGVDILDDNDKPVQFEDTPEGLDSERCS